MSWFHVKFEILKLPIWYSRRFKSLTNEKKRVHKRSMKLLEIFNYAMLYLQKKDGARSAGEHVACF